MLGKAAAQPCRRQGQLGRLRLGVRAAVKWEGDKARGSRAWVQLCLALLYDLGLAFFLSESSSSSYPTPGPGTKYYHEHTQTRNTTCK